MPRNTPRIETDLPAETRRRLEKYRRDLSDKAGKRVSMNALVKTIIEMHLGKVDVVDMPLEKILK